MTVQLLRRIRERKLVQWAVVYLAGAWLFLEALGFVAETFGWSGSVARSAILIAAVGFFAVLVVAWYHGEKGEQRVSGLELSLLAALAIVAGGLVVVFGREPAPTGARHVVLGTAVATGSQVRLAANVRELERGDLVHQAQVDGPADGMIQLVDRLSIELLRFLLHKGAAVRRGPVAARQDCCREATARERGGRDRNAGGGVPSRGWSIAPDPGPRKGSAAFRQQHDGPRAAGRAAPAPQEAPSEARTAHRRVLSLPR